MPMPDLLPTLAAELERPRPLTLQVMNHLSGNYGLERDALGPFLESQWSKLEDYEVDLILSPLFTPSLADQAVFAELLGAESVPASTWPGLIQALVDRPTRGSLMTEDGQNHLLPLRDVTIERFVRRLRLDGAIPATLFDLLRHLLPAADRPLLTAIARRATWENVARREILVQYLTVALRDDQYRRDDAVELLTLAETYQPAHVADLLGRMPHWEQVLRHEINLAANPKAFLNERVEELHGGGRDQRRQDNARIDQKERELAALQRLQRALTAPSP